MPAFEEYSKEHVWEMKLDKETQVQLLSVLQKRLEGPLTKEQEGDIRQIVEELYGIGELDRGASFRQVFLKRRHLEYIEPIAVSLDITSPVPIVK